MNVYKMRRLLTLLLVIGLTSCGVPPDQIIEERVKTEVAISPQASEATDAWINPYPEYCFQRVGQIGADGHQTEPRRGEICEAGAGGAGAFERGTGSDPRNMAIFSLSTPSLKAVGMRSFSFSLNRKSAYPKFTTGVHVMDQYDTRALEEVNPLNVVLPDRLGSGSSVKGDTSMFTHTVPDAARLRAITEVDFSGYEIASAILTINKTVDVPLDEADADHARRANMVIGQQYIEGTFTLSLIPLGSTGTQYGPTTFEFGTLGEWGYVKSLNGENK